MKKQNVKKRSIITGIIALVVVLAIAAIVLPPTWSKRSFEAVVEETTTHQNGEMRLVVRRTTEIYGNPLNSLHISRETELIGRDGEAISIEDIKPGYAVKVTLKDSFIEESLFYYPTVYEIRMIKVSD